MTEAVLAVLRESVASTGGRLLDATVESLPAVFRSASAAIACARLMQQRVADLDLAAGRVTLRVAVHVGEPLAIEDGRFFGSAMWTAARLSARTGAGHITASAVVIDVLAEADRARSSPLGTVQLKGLAEPVVVLDIAWLGVDIRHVGDQRITTVLSVDQVGSTAIIDAEGDAGARTVHSALLDVIRESVEDNNGSEFEYGGDGVGVRFDSAVEAVACSVAMQQAAYRYRRRFPNTAELHLRVAIATGEEDGADRDSLGRLAVEANLLGKSATSDRILVSEITFALADPRRLFQFESVRDEVAGGYRVEWEPMLAEQSLPRPLAPIANYVGRTSELERLSEEWRAMNQGGVRRTLLIEGDAGIGKTALLARFAENLLRGADPAVAPVILYGRCPEGPAGAYEVVTEAFSSAIATASRADLRRTLSEHAPLLSTVLPGLRARLPGLAAAPALGTATEPFAIARAVDALLDGIAAASPALVVLDDVQDASPEFFTMLRALAGRRADQRVLVVLLLRAPDFGRSPVPAALSDAARRDAAPFTELALRGLATDEIELLLNRLIGAAPPPDLLRTIASESEGVPYFVLELARSRLQRDAEAIVLRRVEQVEAWRLDIREVQDEVAADVFRLRQLNGGSAADTGPVSLDAEGTPPIAGPNPYRGLAAFEVDDADWFFGREQLTAELVAHLAVSRMLAVVGASGSGKSSVVRAGLLPALAAGDLPGSSAWRLLLMTPGADPVGSLAAALAPLTEQQVEEVRARLGREGLQQTMGSVVPDGARLVLVVDQAEELFTDAAEPQRDAFVELLTGALDTGAPLALVLVMRSDFYGAWAAYPRLRSELERNHVLIGAMQDDEIRRAIESPAGKAGLVVERSLTDAIVADITGESGALPLLSTVLVETWHRRRGRSLTLTAYAEAGGVRRALANLADSIYAALTAEQQAVARRLLLRLARPAEHDESVEVRRRARIDELEAVSAAAPDVLDVLIDRRLLRKDETTVEVVHEALLREWPLLRGWLAEDRQGRIVAQQLADDAFAWSENDHDADRLYQGARLAVASELAAALPDELDRSSRDFLEASRARTADELQRARRSASRLRRLAVGLVVVLVVALVAGGAAVVQGQAAAKAATAARASSLSSNSALLLDSHQDLGGLLATSADSLDPTAESRAALVDAANRSLDLTAVDTLSENEEVQALSSDGRAVAVIGKGNAVRVLATTTGKELGLVRAPGMDATPPQLSPSGKYVAMMSQKGTAKVYDVASGRSIVDLPRGYDIAFTSDSMVAIVDWKKERTHYVAVPSGKEIALPASSRGGAVVGSADGRVIGWGDSDEITLKNGAFSFGPSQTAHLVDATSGATIGKAVPGALMAVNRDGTLMAVLRGTDLAVVRVSDGVVVAKASVGRRIIDSDVWIAARATAVFNAESSELAFIGADPGHPLYVLHVATSELTTSMVPLPHAQSTPAFDDVSKSLVVLGQHAAARYSEPSTWTAPPGGEKAPRDPRFEGSSSSAFVAADAQHDQVLETEEVDRGAAGVDTRYRLLRQGRAVAMTLQAPAGSSFDARTAAFSQDGRLVATLEAVGGTNSAVMSVWSTTTGREVARFGPFGAAQPSAFGFPIASVVFIGGTTRIAVVTTPPGPTAVRSADGNPNVRAHAVRLQVWDWRTNGKVKDVSVGTVNSVAFSRSGERMAVLEKTGLELWDMSRAVRLSKATASGWSVTAPTSLVFSTNERYVVMATGGLAQRWSTTAPARPKEVTWSQSAEDHGWAVSPDASIVASIGSQGIEIRDLGSGALMRTVAEGVGAEQLLGFSTDSTTVVAWDGSALRAIDARDGSTETLGTAYAAPASDVLPDDPGAAFTRDTVFTLITTGRYARTDRYVISRAAASNRVCSVVGRNLTKAEWDRYVPGTPYRAVCPRWPMPKS